MIKLPSITLIALTGIGYRVDEHVEAIEKSTENISFGAVKLIQLGQITDIDSWNRAIIYELYKYVDTEFCLLIHADGYVQDATKWRDEFLSYDYVGAPFPLPTDDFSYRDVRGNLQRVGNSVSLRSKRLIQLAPQLGLEWKSYYGYSNEDGFICVNNRHIYEDAGMKFAPLEVAIHFSKEHEILENKDIKTFAFHHVDR